MKDFLVGVTRNPISLLGAAITTAAAVLILSLFGMELAGFHGGPYIGIIAFLILPGFFVLGLLLIPFGLAWQRRREARAAARGETVQPFPIVDLNLASVRKVAMVVFLLSIVNVVILATATYKGIEVSESTQFCGTTCHTVMQPEYTAWQHSPHSRVRCVECHIGPGADWFVKSKLSGSWQVIAVTLNLYPRPIGTPVHNLRPARETCEQCHWPTKFVGERLKVRTHYDEDEANTEKKTVLMVRVGGKQGGQSHGIHWHVDPNIEIRYRSDEKRERVDEIEVRRPDGTVDVYYGPDPAKDAAPAANWKVMDCVDCHNRPSHIYRMPDQALDQSIVEGRIDRALPYVRREGLKILQGEYASHDEARSGMPAALKAFYAKEYPQLAASHAAQIQKAGDELAEIFSHNVFPAMKVTWGTYPNHIGHQQAPGCFRCHDGEHKTKTGKVIDQDCTTCHALLAMDEVEPAILKQIAGE